MEDVEVLRRLGQHERFCLARHNIGFPPVLCILATGELDADDDDGQREEIASWCALLRERIRYCLDHVPHLSSFVHGEKTFEPRFARRRTDQVSVDEVFATESTDDLQPGTLMTNMQRWSTEHLDVTQAPLWRVRFFVMKEHSKAFAVALQTHHIITDGMAMCNLFQLLVLSSDASLPTPANLLGSMAATRPAYLPPTSNETMATVAPLSWTAMKLFKMIALPALPLPDFAKRRLGVARSWPQGVRLNRRAGKADVRWHYVEVKSKEGVLLMLKQAAVALQIKSINPIVHTCAILALFVFLKRKRCTIAIQTAASERRTAEHGMICGNFVSVFDWLEQIDESVNVWKITKRYADDLNSPAALYQRSRTWSLMPDVFGAYGERRHRRTREQPTEWEAYFETKANSPSPYSASIGLSNIGLLASMDDRLKRAAWAQVAQPIGDAFTLDVLGWRKTDAAATTTPDQGISLVVSLRTEVFCQTDEEQVFTKALQQAILLFANGQIDERTTFGHLAQHILPFV